MKLYFSLTFKLIKKKEIGWEIVIKPLQSFRNHFERVMYCCLLSANSQPEKVVICDHTVEFLKKMSSPRSLVEIQSSSLVGGMLSVCLFLLRLCFFYSIVVIIVNYSRNKN